MDGLPPAQYDHPYGGPVIERIVSWDELNKVCPGIENLRACTYPPSTPGGTCYVFMPKVGPGGVDQKYWNQLHRHEIGHCNGWPANHPV